MNVPKTYKQFENTLNQNGPDADWPLTLQALWFAANDQWNAAHDIAQDLHTSVGSWIHAHLHRVEGDDFNAGYWYQQAGKPFCNSTLSVEVQELVKAVL
ncbi:hypothetical protein [uncultured Croceitalea sp.]|uniref:hypothetical protein n=1 Tax=uncultured Croceitalea sp. TaxID=1798908 RepID=UPI003305E0AF